LKKWNPKFSRKRPSENAPERLPHSFFQSAFWDYNSGMKKYLAQFLLLFLAAISLGLATGRSAPPLSLTPAATQLAISDAVPQAAAPIAGAKDAIRHVLDLQVIAWNRADLEGFMKGYWHSPELTFYSGGNIATGWQAALERYQRNYQSAGKEMGTLEFQDLDIDVLTATAAVVYGKWQLTKSDGTTPHGLFTLVLKRMQPGWQIVHDHTSSADAK
jgi:ketosteroid isomerase-like protein